MPLTFLLEALREFVPQVDLLGIQPELVAFGYPMSKNGEAGRALTMRSSLVMLPASSCGTLKSTRIRTRFALTSISATVFLAIADIPSDLRFMIYHLRCERPFTNRNS